MKNGRLQCKDISDISFIAALATTSASDDTFKPTSWRLRYDVQDTLERMLDLIIPEKLFQAKAKVLKRRKLVDGCTCGCRGDYHFPDQ